MTKYGVSKYQATKAYDAVHTEEHRHVERQRRELLARTTGAGVAQDKLVEELSKRLANRVTIGPGPKGLDVSRPQATGGRAWGGGRLPGTGRSSVGDLAKLISGWRSPKPKSPVPVAKATNPTAPAKLNPASLPAKAEEPVKKAKRYRRAQNGLPESSPAIPEVASKRKSRAPDDLFTVDGDLEAPGELIPPKSKLTMKPKN